MIQIWPCMTSSKYLLLPRHITYHHKHAELYVNLQTESEQISTLIVTQWELNPLNVGL